MSCESSLITSSYDLNFPHISQRFLSVGSHKHNILSAIARQIDMQESKLENPSLVKKLK